MVNYPDDLQDDPWVSMPCPPPCPECVPAFGIKALSRDTVTYSAPALKSSQNEEFLKTWSPLLFRGTLVPYGLALRDSEGPLT